MNVTYTLEAIRQKHENGHDLLREEVDVLLREIFHEIGQLTFMDRILRLEKMVADLTNRLENAERRPDALTKR